MSGVGLAVSPRSWLIVGSRSWASTCHQPCWPSHGTRTRAFRSRKEASPPFHYRVQASSVLCAGTPSSTRRPNSSTTRSPSSPGSYILRATSCLRSKLALAKQSIDPRSTGRRRPSRATGTHPTRSPSPPSEPVCNLTLRPHADLNSPTSRLSRRSSSLATEPEPDSHLRCSLAPNELGSIGRLRSPAQRHSRRQAVGPSGQLSGPRRQGGWHRAPRDSVDANVSGRERGRAISRVLVDRAGPSLTRQVGTDHQPSLGAREGAMQPPRWGS